MKQFTITGTKTFTYYKTVHADDITEAHLLAHEDVEDEVIKLNTNFSNWVFSLKNEKHQQHVIVECFTQND